MDTVVAIVVITALRYTATPSSYRHNKLSLLPSRHINTLSLFLTKQWFVCDWVDTLRAVGEAAA
jgi:hypothetical protein